ncbi:MAG: hypothetical protein ACI4JD_07555 [Ruminococcus sp.]
MKPWKSKNGNCKCESCGKTVTERELKWEKGLAYCVTCYLEIQNYKKIKSIGR